MRISKLTLLASLVLASVCQADSPAAKASDKDWIQLFNGKDLSDWTIKIAGYEANDNAFNTFRVNDGVLQVRYDEYEKFENQFGHIFSNHGPFSHYIIQVEYRFVGDQVKDGPAWAQRNNGIMYHTQSADSMTFTQWFPTSMEYQLLGGNGTDERTTGNLCTPDTKVVIDGKLREDHCIVSTSDTFHGDQWVTAELEVHGSKVAIHRINGKKVMEYNDLQLDDGTPLEGGFIALQGETHPTDFRSVRLLNLKGCMDSKAKNYQAWYVADDKKSCKY